MSKTDLHHLSNSHFAGKTVLLTGASRGIGVHIARALAAKQATVIGVSRSAEGLDKVCEEVNNLGGKGIAIPFDISKVSELPKLLQQIEQLGGVDILINNAGVEMYRAFPDYSLAEMQSVLSINLVAAMELTRLVLPGMLNRGNAHIVNIASLAAKKGHPYDSIYSASKAGLLMWADALRQELASTGVGISTICPGYISGQGMMADTGIPAPSLAGTSTPHQVAIALIKAIEQNQGEVIVNSDPITANLTKLLLAISQFFPSFGDTTNRLLGVTKLNRLRIETSRRHQSELVKTEA
ncbi:SDR family NAD(P)-dependent oxidoreductase [Aliterella atlantica]|uniref:SDR family NAD(P)-dependent oxidoreductase n=1 Tax=Aliterella atlantica TaxID=1827278 RepID=UPI0005D31E5E|nr:SDR family oxidoreductase [Aliterella atlantica]